MIVAIMQPYFFPYIGYFQLMAAVDTFVFLDDVQYVERSWMNRNRIRRDNQGVWLSMPVRNGPRTAKINERRYLLGDSQSAIAGKIQVSYCAAPFYEEGSTLVMELVRHAQENVANFNAHLLRKISRQLGINPDIVLSSSTRSDERLAGQAGILEICRRLGATRYINAIGGTKLYNEAAFEDAGIELQFLRTRAPPVALADGPEHLSIIDGLMRDGVAGCMAVLPEYELLSPEAARACA